jgi:hypothetical protein
MGCEFSSNAINPSALKDFFLNNGTQRSKFDKGTGEVVEVCEPRDDIPEGAGIFEAEDAGTGD